LKRTQDTADSFYLVRIIPLLLGPSIQRIVDHINHLPHLSPAVSVVVIITPSRVSRDRGWNQVSSSTQGFVSLSHSLLLLPQLLLLGAQVLKRRLLRCQSL
jgi:hypothetical protein